MLKLILTIGMAGLLAACANTTGSMASRGDGSDTSTMGAPGNSMGVGVQGYMREPANF